MQIQARRHAQEQLRAFGLEVVRQREDAGVSQAALARAANVSPGQLCRIETGQVGATVPTMAAIAAALGARLSIRVEPATGPPIRDRFQARMVEELVRSLHSRWKRFVEVPLYRPVRGVIDIVLHDPDEPVVVAAEAHSQIRRLEQQLRWSSEKADALPSSEALPATVREAPVSRLLILRSTRHNRELAAAFAATLETAYPAPTRAVYEALTGMSPWPGSGILWVTVDGRATSLLRDPPRSVQLGRQT